DPFGRLWATYDNETNRGDIDNRGDGDPVTKYRYWDNNWNDPYGGDSLDPAGDAPFFIAVQQRPESFSAPANSSGGFAYNDQTFYDGFGRPIQTRSIWASVDGENLTREIFTTTEYDALGRAACATTPFDVPFYSDRNKVWPDSAFVPDSCASKPHTSTTYDALGRPLFVTAPDGNNTEHRYPINDVH
ncbi:MAG: hypothetical protein GY803_07230, partial [Chloroflexi bacterium]|nr:hypothetical protein [Chloroflexota bacterium]